MEEFFQRQFLVVYGLVVTFVVISLLLISRKPPQPFKLRMRDEKSPRSKARSQGQVDQGPLDTGGSEGVEVYPDDFEPSVKQLGVMFNFNGHSWEAFESLGLPAGSSVEDAQRAFERLKTRQGGEVDDFYLAAYRAILQSR